MSATMKARKAKAVEIVSSLVPSGGRILEVSCGDGRVLTDLRALGYSVLGTNYTRHPDTVADLAVDDGVDILKGIPCEAGRFDAVLLLDVIEHLSDHVKAVSELARVCRDGGIVLIGAPNILKLSSRLQFLLTGMFKTKRAFVGFDVAPESAFAFHNHPPHLPVLLYQMISHGLEPVSITRSGCKTPSIVFFVLFYPLIRLSTALKMRHDEKNLRGTRAGRMLERELTSFACLCGEHLLVAGRKAAGKAGESETALPAWSKRI